MDRFGSKSASGVTVGVQSTDLGRGGTQVDALEEALEALRRQHSPEHEGDEDDWRDVFMSQAMIGALIRMVEAARAEERK